MIIIIYYILYVEVENMKQKREWERSWTTGIPLYGQERGWNLDGLFLNFFPEHFGLCGQPKCCPTKAVCVVHDCWACDKSAIFTATPTGGECRTICHVIGCLMRFWRVKMKQVGLPCDTKHCRMVPPVFIATHLMRQCRTVALDREAAPLVMAVSAMTVSAS